MFDFVLEKGDQYPSIQATLCDANGSVNLNGTSVDFIYRPKNNPTGVPITGGATIVAATSGIAKYDWPSPMAKGLYYGRWRTTFSNGKIMTFPNDALLLFEITDDLM